MQAPQLYMARSANDLYGGMVEDLLKMGSKVSPRNKPTLEMRPVYVEMVNPLDYMVTANGRMINLPFALAELVWILSGNNRLDMLVHYNSKYAQFSDDGYILSAAYGRRMRHAQGDFDGVFGDEGVDQFKQALQKLEFDNDSRQAIITYWDPVLDNALYIDEGGAPRLKRDYPCNVLSMLKIREGKLHWTQVIRSNDIVWGTPYNWIQFPVLMIVAAQQLGLELGSFNYVADSLHIYEDKIEEAKGISDFDLMRNLNCQPYTIEDYACNDFRYLAILEECIRFGNYYQNWPNNQKRFFATLGKFWQSSLNIMMSFREFKQHRDHRAFEMANLLDDFHKSMLLKNYYQWRWSKNMVKYSDFINHLEVSNYPEVFEWITETKAVGESSE